MFSKRRKNFMENFFITSIFCFYQNSKNFPKSVYWQSRTASGFSNTFHPFFSKNHTNINKSTINHGNNVAWFIENNRQKMVFNDEIIVANMFVCIKKERKSF